MLSLAELTKGLSETQKRCLKKLMNLGEPTSAYRLGESLATLYSLEKKNLVRQAKHDPMGDMFSPQTNIPWVSKFRFKAFEAVKES